MNYKIQLLKKILAKYKINPKNLSIYLEALTHPTYSNEQKLKYNYQRLEFLGDAAISWIVSNYLYGLKLPESQMSLYKSNIVKGKTLAKIAREDFKLQELIFKGNGLTELTDKVLEDVFESFIGAIYQDQGIKKVKQILDIVLLEKVDNNAINLEKSYKTQFQECMMKNQKNNTSSQNQIKYVSRMIPETKQWEVQLFFENNLYGTAISTTIRGAEELAAKEAMNKLAKLD